MLGFLTPLIPLWKLLSVIENSLAERKKVFVIFFLRKRGDFSLLE